MVTAIVIVVYGVTIAFDFLPKRKELPRKEMWTYLTLMFVSFTIIMLYSVDVILPGPTGLITSIVKGIDPQLCV